MSTSIPKHAQAVIIGGGVVGCSVAYHLSKLGYKDVVLLERKKLTSGTTWHAAGLVGQMRSSLNLTQMVKYSGNLYETLESETGTVGVSMVIAELSNEVPTLLIDSTLK